MFRGIRAPQTRLIRTIHSSSIRPNLFGGKKVTQNDLGAPSGKGEGTTNPVDILKKNDILMYSNKPINYIESVKENGFHLANNIMIQSPDKEGNIIGALLIETENIEVNLSNEGFKIINGFMIEFKEEVLGIFEKIHPKPEIVVMGLGGRSRMLSEKNRVYFAKLGIQLEIGDSNNAAQIFDLLATERPNVILAFLLPPNV
ncbi:hypothetical protein HYPBUDRAFT_153755 [Hyphopichia burtonii NRRL Y-1933]|uniref:NADH dehydrogenase [ubiquinone] 1 alpha subcomplex assembly factor 3 n=1 Tax=Hyphopichia burtonii NRRL Y-1933 TaxID=984485 RepID=A0A1E4RDZ5_9ASCO|nr:hypothetical protein HYPBUDRAFT_153755 [Hyphopichia burtonii NRRL Y-1933]ODV65446.1 hypothetical protein HYPBUDRAFT_153755 [Hyphopichia burtonii NRRL Y-1933]